LTPRLQFRSPEVVAALAEMNTSVIPLPPAKRRQYNWVSIGVNAVFFILIFLLGFTVRGDA